MLCHCFRFKFVFIFLNIFLLCFSDYTVIDGDLLISRLRPEDAGTYVCSATNEYGQTDIPVELNVGCKLK